MDRIPLALGSSKSLFFANIIQTFGVVTAMGGYFIGGLSGFIVGLAAGPVAAHLFLVFYLPLLRMEMIWQTARFTAMAGSAGAAAVAATLWLRTVAVPGFWVAAVVVFAGVPMLVSAGVVYFRLRGDDHRAIIPKSAHVKAGAP
jgi:hypothetical protein